MITVRQTISFIAAMVALIAITQVAAAVANAAAGAGAPAASKVSRVSSPTNRQLMKSARLLFEKQEYRKALDLYEKIPQDSDYWIEAVEERAWSHVHLKEHDQALANVKTLFAPPINAEIGAEPYLLSTLIQLRLCNYDELFKVMKRFKKDVRPRFEALQALQKSGENEASVKMFERAMKSKALTRASAGDDIAKLPRLFYRDAKLQKTFSSLIKKSGPTAASMTAVQSRMKTLAARDVKETEVILRKLHLVEVESVSRMYSGVNLADAKKTSPAIERNANTLVFPDDDDDVWIDELDSYRVNAKGCPAVSATKGPQS